MDRKFEAFAATPEHEGYGELTSRETPLYGRSDDIRSEFARDYTRVLHCLAYRRLKHKTQVFFNAAGNDHICTRIEHVEHVESVSHTIAGELGLNEELTKAIAIAHDLGHAPFGHRGEKVLSHLSLEHLGKKFWHEQNGLYFVDSIELLENNQGFLQNLNLTYAVRDGIISHCGELDEIGLKPRNERFPLSSFQEPGQYQAATYEGCVVKLADKFAYLGRDIEDAKRLFYFGKKELKILKELAGPAASATELSQLNTTVIIHNLIIDLCKNSTPEKGLSLSPEMNQILNEVKQFNYEYIYGNRRLGPFNAYSELVLTELFRSLRDYYLFYGNNVIAKLARVDYDRKSYVKDFVFWLAQYCSPDCLPSSLRQSISERCKNMKIYGSLSDEKTYLQAVIDFIAGMTDNYAINAFQELLRC